MNALQIAALGVAASFCALIIRSREPVLATAISIVSGIFVFVCILGRIEILFEYMRTLTNGINDGDYYFTILLKASGIAMISEFAAGICKESGMLSICEMIRMFAKISLFLLGIPILTAVINMIGGYSL